MLGAAVGLGQYAIGLWWVTEFNGAGYVALVALAMAFTAGAGAGAGAGVCAGAAARSRTRTRVGVVIGLPAALVVSDWVRGHFPFGGLPLGGIPLGQAAGPLAPVARMGGPLLVTGTVTAAGASLMVLVTTVACARRSRTSRDGLGAAAAAVMLALVVTLVVAGRLGPDGGGGRRGRPVSVAAVQGGGARGLHANEVAPDVVFRRQVAATTDLHLPLHLVVWPEDVINVNRPIGDTPEGATVGQLARQLNATIVAGVVEDVGADRFRNAAVAWSPAGVIVARYDKVHRVPFGEYVPGRRVFQHLANLALVPRDAIAGRGPGLLATPAGPLGTVISYEVFFPDRARAAIDAGGQLLVVPTNASSYRTSQVPTQEVAAAQLRAWETGRDTIQAAPTGYSALIDHDGRILARSTLGLQQVITGRLVLRTGRTVFVRLGEVPVVLLAILGLLAPVRLARRPG